MVENKRAPVPKVTNNAALNILLASEFGDQVQRLIGDDLHEFCDLDSVGSSSPSDWENDLRDEMGLEADQKITRKTRERSNSLYDLFPMKGTVGDSGRPASPPHNESPSFHDQHRQDDEETAGLERPLFKNAKHNSHSRPESRSSRDPNAHRDSVSSRLEKVESQKAALKKELSTPTMLKSASSMKLPEVKSSVTESRRSSTAEGSKLGPPTAAPPTKPTVRRNSSVASLPAATGASGSGRPLAPGPEEKDAASSFHGTSRRPSLASSASSAGLKGDRFSEKTDSTSAAKRLLSTYGAVDTAKTVMNKKIAPVTPLAAQLLVKTASTVLKKK